MSGFKVKWDVSKVRAILEIGGQEGLSAAAHAVAHDSLKEVPIGNGVGSATLERSLEVSVDPGIAAISYDTPYAAYQHEGKRADGTHIITRHSRQGRKTKYLEDPVNAFAQSDRLLHYLADKVKF